MKPARQVVEQRVQIPMGDDRFRYRQQGSVLLARGRQFVSCKITHDESRLASRLAPNSRENQPARDVQDRIKNLSADLYSIGLTCRCASVIAPTWHRPAGYVPPRTWLGYENR